jgi:ferredoxin--NADP+ reductase
MAMFKILKAEMLCENICQQIVEAPRIAHSCLPGQFVIVRADETSERIPLTISDYDREKGTVTITLQIIGASSMKIAQYKTGDSFADIVGPLGKPSELCTDPIEEVRKKRVLFVGGGLGTAPVYPQVKWCKENGVEFDVVIGTKCKDTLIMEKEFEDVAGEHYFLTTDDGSYGRTGNVTVCLESLVKEENKSYDVCVAIGPMIMMKFVCLMTEKLGIKTIVSMNPIMVDGTGMCGGCRLTVGGETKFACVDGPDFDGFLVDFDEAMARGSVYKPFETKAREEACNLLNAKA